MHREDIHGGGHFIIKKIGADIDITQIVNGWRPRRRPITWEIFIDSSNLINWIQVLISNSPCNETINL